MKLDDKMNLDVAAPDLVPMVLSRVVEKYRASAAELRSAWQDGNAGAEWNKIANVLEKADVKIREMLASMGYTQFSDK